MMEIKLDSAAMAEMVQKTLFDTLTEEQREGLIRGAIAELLKKERVSVFDTATSKIEQIFRREIEYKAERYLRSELENPESELSRIFEEMYKQALKKMLEAAREKTVDDLSAAISNAFYRR